MAEAIRAGAGVDALIARIRDEAIAVATAEAEHILEKARREAAALLDDARRDAEAYKSSSRAEIATERTAAEEALRIAIRDTSLALSARIADAFERHVRRLVSQHTLDKEVIKAMLLVLAGRAAEEFVRDKEILVKLPRLLFDEHPDGTSDDDLAELHRNVLGLTHEMLREGIELLPTDGLAGGARIQLVGEDLEIDLSDRAVSQLLLKQLMPRYRAIMEGLE